MKRSLDKPDTLSYDDQDSPNSNLDENLQGSKKLKTDANTEKNITPPPLSQSKARNRYCGWIISFIGYVSLYFQSRFNNREDYDYFSQEIKEFKAKLRSPNRSKRSKSTGRTVNMVFI